MMTVICLVPDEIREALGLQPLTEKELEWIRLQNPGPRVADRIAGRIAAKAAFPEANQLGVEVENDENGAPWYSVDGARRSDLNLSIAHSHGWGAAARSNVASGVDVELLRPISDKVQQRALTPNELQLLSRRWATEDRLVGFLTLWTLKEAACKALGLGLKAGLHKVEVRMCRFGIARIKLPDGRIARGTYGFTDGMVLGAVWLPNSLVTWQVTRVRGLTPDGTFEMEPVSLEGFGEGLLR